MKKSIFITGAASGIGRATAILFAKKGWNVGLFDINEQGLESVAKEIGHNMCMYQKLDVTKIDEWKSAEENFSNFSGGKCDLFFNNAGIANFAGKFEDIPSERCSVYLFLSKKSNFSTYLINASTSRFTLSPIDKNLRFVLFQVCGIIAIVKISP